MVAQKLPALVCLQGSVIRSIQGSNPTIDTIVYSLGHGLHTLRPMSHLRQSRATLTPDKGSRVKVTSVTGRVARCVVARRTVATLVFGIERCSVLWGFDARQSRASDTRHNRRCDTGLTSTFSIGRQNEHQLRGL